MLAAWLLLLVGAAPTAPVATTGSRSCFLLTELGSKRPAAASSPACDERVSPASTFKIPHALAALDAGVASGPDQTFRHDGDDRSRSPSWQRDHTLASAMHHSVLWVFQRIAGQLGPERERAYLRKLDYGNGDISSGLTGFWNGGSLKISPREQERFVRRLFEDALPVSPAAQSAVRRMLIQPRDRVINAAGEHPVRRPLARGHGGRAPRPDAAGQDDGTQVRWLVGQVRRGRSPLGVRQLRDRRAAPAAGGRGSGGAIAAGGRRSITAGPCP